MSFSRRRRSVCRRPHRPRPSCLMLVVLVLIIVIVIGSSKNRSRDGINSMLDRFCTFLERSLILAVYSNGLV